MYVAYLFLFDNPYVITGWRKLFGQVILAAVLYIDPVNAHTRAKQILAWASSLIL